MTHDQSNARTATVAGLARLAGLAAMTGTDAITADSVTLCPPPADACLVGLCADLTEMEQISRSRGGVGGRLVQRQALMTAICKTKAISCNGVKSKARVVRLVLGDRVVSRHMHDALISSLLEDIQGETLR